jgi:hypothetical protein
MGGEQKFAKLGTHGMDPALGFPEERVFLWESPRYPTGGVQTTQGLEIGAVW